MKFLNKNLFIYLTLFISLIHTQELVTFTESEINAGDTASIQLLLDNIFEQEEIDNAKKEN